MTLVSFRLLRKNVGNLREFLGEWFTAPPGKKLPIRLWALPYNPYLTAEIWNKTSAQKDQASDRKPAMRCLFF